MTSPALSRRSFRTVAEAEAAMLELKKQLVDLRRDEREQRLEKAYTLVRQMDNYLGHDATLRLIEDLKKQLKTSRKVRGTAKRPPKARPETNGAAVAKPDE